MKKAVILAAMAVILVWLSSPALAQDRSPVSQGGLTVRPGLRLEILSRTLKWDGEDATSKLKAPLLAATAVLEFEGGVDLALTAGVSFSDFKGLVFRKLPFSLDYQAGGVTGILVGIAVGKSLFEAGDFEIKASGRLVSSFGLNKTWAIEGLAVDGQAKGKPSWIQIAAGPSLVYTGAGSLRPYASLEFVWLQGSFSMRETVDVLNGTEDKKFKGKGLFQVSLGGIYDLSDALSVEAEAYALPYGGGLDIGGRAGILFSF